MNLTHSEPVANFPQRYGEEAERWRSLLVEFGPDDLRAWAEELAVETYVGTSGRVFPRGQKAAVLLRAWLKRLAREWGRDSSAAALDPPDEIGFRLARPIRRRAATFEIEASAVVLALGGASWPETGSDGSWPPVLAEHDIEVTAVSAGKLRLER